MIISKREHQEKMEMAEPLKDIIDKMTNCHIKELPEVIASNLKWERPREALFIWIPVLNRIDEIFEDIIKRYELDQDFPKLQVMNEWDQKIAISCLEFTYMLLDHCSSRSIYNSTERIYDLLKTPTIDVRIHVLEVILSFAEFFTDYRRVVPRLFPSKENKLKVLSIATSYPPLIPQSFLNNQSKSDSETKPTLIGDHYSFLDTLKTTKKYPSKWKTLNFQYFNSETVIDMNEEKKNKKQKIKGEMKQTIESSKSNKKDSKNTARHEGLSSFTLSEDLIRKLTLEQIFDKANETIPKEHLFEFGLYASVIKSFNNRSYESIKLREKLLQCKMLAVAFICCAGSTEFTSSRLFETEPYILSFLTELVEPENKVHLSREVYFSAIKSLECIPLNRVWGGDIIRSMGGNVNHGILFQIIRRIHKEITEEENTEIFERANVHFFNMISNLFSCNSLLPGLVSAGLLDELLCFFNLKSKYRWTCSAATHLTALFLNNSTESLDAFIQKDGFNLLIETINHEVKFALNNPNYGNGAPKEALVFYKISFRQANYIRNLMKFVSKLLLKTPGDRARNLYDSPLLNTFNQILLNADIFGPDILSATLDSVFYIINNEPTAYSILNEANVINTILDNYESLFAPSSDLFMSLPEVLGTFCLLKGGLKLVVEKNAIETYFRSFYNLQLVKQLMKSDTSLDLGNVFQELGNHHPDLKPIIMNSVISVTKNMPSYANELLDGVQFYTSESGSLYHDKTEAPSIFEEGSKEIESWDSMPGAYLIDNILLFLDGYQGQGSESNTDTQHHFSFDYWLNYLSIENLPFDMFNSNGKSSLMMMLELFDEERDYGFNLFPAIIQKLVDQFDEPLIQDYIYYSDTKSSFFTRFENNPSEGTLFLRKLNVLNNFLFTIAEVYLKHNLNFHKRYLQIADLFSKNNSQLIEYMTLLLKRSILEEAIIRSCSPDIIAKETIPTSEVFSDYPPLQIFTHDPHNEVGKRKEGTSAKFKNTLQIRFFSYRIQCSVSIILRSIGRICMSRDQEMSEVNWRKDAVNITVSVGKALTSILDTKISDINIEVSYQLVLIQICDYISTQSDTTKEIMFTSLVISFFQNGFFDVLKKIGVSLWNMLLAVNPEDAAKVNDLKYISSDISNILKVALSHIFVLIGKSVNSDSLPTIPQSKMYFTSGYKDPESNIIPNLLVQSKLMAIEFINEVIGPNAISTDANFQNIPFPILEQIIFIYKQVWLGYKETSVDFIPLDVNNVIPPEYHVNYLCNAGLNLAQVENFFNQGYRIEDFQNLTNRELTDLEISEEESKRAVEYYEKNKSDLSISYPKSRGLKELQEIRNMNKENFMSRWITVLKVFPGNMNSISDLIISLSDSTKIVDEIFQILISAVNNGDKNNFGILANILSLTLKNEKIIKINPKFFQNFIDFFVTKFLEKQYVNDDYFANFLDILVQVMTYDDIPTPEYSKIVGSNFIGLPKVFTLSNEDRKLIFEKVINLEGFHSIQTASALVNILIFYSKNNESGSIIAKSKVLKELLKLVKVYCNSKEKNFESFQSSVVILLRRCFETQKILQTQMEAHIPKLFSSSIRGKRDLNSCLKDSSSLILRNPDIYVDVISKYVRLDGYLSNGDLHHSKIIVNYMEPEVDADVEMEDAEEKENSSKNLDSTGIIHILLLELMEVSKQDWVSDPESSSVEENSEITPNKQKKGDKRDNLFKNSNFCYASFLLQTIIELIGSYKQCKFEFLTFSRKKLADQNIKPRATALNFLIHQLVPTKSLISSKGPEFNRRSVISSLAKVAILALISTPLTEYNSSNPKVEDIDMAFIRKFYVEVLSKTLSETYNLPNIAIDRYGKLLDLFHLCGSVITPKFRQLAGLLLDDTATKYDQYFIAKALIEKHIPQQITSILSGLDLNFPNINKVIKSGIKPISILGKIKVDFSDLFEANYQGDKEVDEIVPEDLDDREETPDLFRNSTLGMYDVNFDSEEEMDYYDEDGPLDVLMSDEEISDSDGSSVLSDLDSDSDNDDISIDNGHYESSRDTGMEDDGDDNSELGEEIEILDELDIEGHSDDDSFSESSEFSESSDIYGIDDEDDEISEYDPEDLDMWIEEFESDNSSNDIEETYDVNENEDDSLRRTRRSAVGEFESSSSINIESISDEETSDIEIEGRNGTRSSVLDLLGPQQTSQNRNFFLSNVPGIIGGWLDIDTFNLRAPHQAESVLDQIFERAVRISNKENPDVNNKYIKSIKERWHDTMKMFHEKDKEDCSIKIIPAIINRIEADSIELNRKKLEEEERIKKVREERLRKKAEEEKLLREKEAQNRESNPQNDEMSHNLEPVMVRIGDREVDISGTDIDPEFFEALPEDMREEVFTQHVRERRAQANNTGAETREIDPDFLDALPEQIREEILQQESMARRFSIMDDMRFGEEEFDEMEEEEEDDDGEANDTQEGGNENGFDLGNSENNTNHTNNENTGEKKNENKKPCFFTPLLEKQGISSLIRLLFVPQSIMQREFIHHALQYLCYSKQSRIEIMGILLTILHEGINNQRSIEKVYSQISFRSSGIKGNNLQIPVKATPLVVALQVLEAIHHLLEKNTHLRYYLLTEHENPFITKNFNQKKRLSESAIKELKYPINYLFKLLENDILKEEQTFMDILARILQISTRPLHLLEKANKNEQLKSSPFISPVLTDRNFRQVIKLLTCNECPNATFRRSVSAMQNLSILPGAHKIFCIELSDQATRLGQNIIVDLNTLTKSISTTDIFDAENKIFSKFSSPSSDQAKLLRILTALDYMFESKEKEREQESSLDSNDSKNDDIEELTSLYNKLALGTLWDALSDCLRVVEEKPALNNVSAVLLPLIEALMVVCKHSKVKDLQIKDVVKYEVKKIDFAKEPIESLFLSFTDEHKKVLNQMVRTNPNLMSGPFGMLVRNPRVLEFDNKKNYFDRRLHKESKDSAKVSVNIRREQVFLDSYRSLFFKSKDEFRTSKLEVTFKGEAGVDAGGVTREWYQVLSRQMFNPDYALFSPVASDVTTFHPNRTSYVNPEHLSFFKFIGRIIGKAIYDNCFLDCHFSRAVYKRILGAPVSLKDMETLDLEYFKSLIWMLENDITDIITEDFSVETDDYGEHKIIELVPNGSNIPVTEENKHEYVKKVVEYRLQTSVTEQMDNFLIGFHEIIPKDLIAIFDEQELELLISGLPDIDVHDWQYNTTYNNYSASSMQIQWFWRAVKSFDNEQRARLLQFATGTSKVPLNGFKGLGGAYGGTCKFTIHRDYGPTDRLPSSHTCFNQVDLPAYENYETLRGSLLLAVTEGHEGFGLS